MDSNRRGLGDRVLSPSPRPSCGALDGGYTQQDVQELARLLTGWTVDGIGGANRMQAQTAARGRGRGRAPAALPGAEGPVRFAFRSELHEPGRKTILGERYGEGAGEGERAIRALCRHPATAGFVARKLVAHFVSDDPPQAAVDRVARAFRSSDGDLRVVAHALVELPEAWDEGSRKFRTPQDWFVAVLRAFGVPQAQPNAPNLLRQLRQPIWSPPSPKGFGDAASEWADPDSLLNRGELARSIARTIGRRAPDPRRLLDVVDVDGGNPLPDLLADGSIAVEERLALALAGPAFQWR